MQYTVDKEIQNKVFFTHLVKRRFLLHHLRADDDLAVLYAGDVGEDVGGVRLTAQCLIQLFSARSAHKDE